MPRKHDTKVELLGGVSLFRGCNRKELAQIAALTTEIDVPAGDALCKEGQPGREFFVVVDGKATVAIGGKEIDAIGPGNFCGEMALLDGGPRIATVTASTPMQLLVLSSQEFNSLLDDAPAVARSMLKTIGGRLRRAETQEAPAVGV